MFHLIILKITEGMHHGMKEGIGLFARITHYRAAFSPGCWRVGRGKVRERFKKKSALPTKFEFRPSARNFKIMPDQHGRPFNMPQCAILPAFLVSQMEMLSNTRA